MPIDNIAQEWPILSQSALSFTWILKITRKHCKLSTWLQMTWTGHRVTILTDCWQMRWVPCTSQCSLSLDRQQTSPAPSSVELHSDSLAPRPVQTALAVILKGQNNRKDSYRTSQESLPGLRIEPYKLQICFDLFHVRNEHSKVHPRNLGWFPKHEF